MVSLKSINLKAKLTIFITFLFFLFCSVSCTETKQKISSVNDRILGLAFYFIDRLLPSYDSDRPDTENNKKRFESHLETDFNPSVKNIYSYADFLGIDYSVHIAFEADSQTINQIIQNKDMKIVSEEKGGGLYNGLDFPWWHRYELEKMVPYQYGNLGDYMEFLWYDRNNGKAYYQEFSM